MIAMRGVGSWSLAALFALTGCSSAGPSGDEPTGQTAAALTRENGIWQNGLTTNGIWQNGIWQNGIWQNGIWQNGIWQNGIWQNGVGQNGIWQNGIWQNGIWQNGSVENGIWQNGIWQNGIWQNGIWQNGVARDALVSSVYTRVLLQYIYACAMPGSLDPVTNTPIDPRTYDATLDPNNGTLTCNASTPCDEGYTCSAQGKCVVPLTGSIGVGINADETGWWQSGRCDETCQRWVSACVLARTNAYGVHVPISLRAPADAPQPIKNALALGADEGAECRPGVDPNDPSCGFTLREGGFYGNLFATQPLDPAPSTSPIVATPSFYACAGPGSNIPAVTKRFCSSQGDQAVIDVPGMCRPAGDQPGVCDAEDANGNMVACHTATTDHATPDTANPPYHEVITTYLKQPIAVYGNAVCEPPETSDSSPSDCHPGAWASTYDVSMLSEGNQESFLDTANSVHKLAVGPDDSVVIVDIIPGDALCSLGGASLPGDGGPDLVLAKYNKEGVHQWSIRQHLSIFGSSTRVEVYAIAIGDDGSIAAVGVDEDTLTNPLWVTKFGADGTALAGWPITLGGSGSITAGLSAAVDTTGNVVVQSHYYGTPTFGSATFDPPDTSHSFIAYLFADGSAHVGGPVKWVASTEQEQATALAFDSAGDVLATGMYPDAVFKFAAADGEQLGVFPESPSGLGTMFSADDNTDSSPWSIVADAGNNVYVAGGVGNYVGCRGWVAKLGPDLTLRWHTPLDESNDGSCDDSGARFVTIGSAGEVIVAGTIRSPIDFGVGLFQTYEYYNVFVASYASDDVLPPNTRRLQWAKQVPMVLDSMLAGFVTDHRGHFVMAGQYSGSMLLDNMLLVNSDPVQTSHPNAFLGSFAPPSLADVTAPAIGEGRDGAGTTINTVPHTIYAQATDSSGAQVFFMLPTAIDAGAAGTNVVCDPAPNTTFAIGTTQVTCTATDPLGNTSSATFSVVVRDTLGPVFGPTAAIEVDAPTMSGVVVTYAKPTAIDQIDGPVAWVTCAPASGSVFPIGTTAVTCSAQDAKENSSSTSFAVTVKPPPDAIPPTVTVPGDMIVPATSATGAVVTYTASATDDTGVASFACSPPSGSVFPLGTTLVTCTAKDFSNNTTTKTFTLTVQVQGSWFLQPINSDGSSIFKLGSTVTVKFRLTGASAGISDLVANLTLAKISNSIEGSVIEATSTSAADLGSTFRYDVVSGQYIFNLATAGLSKGTWVLRIDTHDGATHAVEISLK